MCIAVENVPQLSGSLTKKWFLQLDQLMQSAMTDCEESVEAHGKETTLANVCDVDWWMGRDGELFDDVAGRFFVLMSDYVKGM
jgi:hypothetical protein